jgi:hypothetical protein
VHISLLWFSDFFNYPESSGYSNCRKIVKIFGYFCLSIFLESRMTKQIQRMDNEDRERPHFQGIIKENERLQKIYPGSNGINIPNIDGWGKHVVIERQLADPSAILSKRYRQVVDDRNESDSKATEMRLLKKRPFFLLYSRDFATNPQSKVAVRPLGKEYHGKWKILTREQYADKLHRLENP